MANVRNGNTWFVDTVGTIATSPIKVYYIIFCGTGATPLATFLDDNSQQIKLTLRGGSTSVIYDFSERPLYFPGGIDVSVLTNAEVTLVISEN